MTTLKAIEADGAARAAITIRAEIAKNVNLAFQQNAQPVIHALSVIHEGGDTLEDLELVMRAEPDELAHERIWNLSRLAAGDVLEITERDVALRPGFLSDLTDAVRAELSFELFAGGRLIQSVAFPTQILAHNQWVGLGEGSELLAAFVAPNDPAIAPILKAASQTLARHQRAREIDGYLSRSKNRAWEIASAIWSAVSELGLDYALPPASFEKEGQKVRLPKQIVDGGLATCLDTCVLFAAALEAAGLHPFVVITEGHAFPGVWLVEAAFPTTVVEDVVALRARVNLDEAIVFESTLATGNKRASFAQALARGRAQITAEEESKFHSVVDIQRARMMDIRPLGAVIERGEETSDGAAPRKPAETVPFEPAPELAEWAFGSDGARYPVERFANWKRRLLDLSLRNRLLNLKPNKSVLTIAAPDLAAIEERLSAGGALSVAAVPDLGLGGRRSAPTHNELTREELLKRYADEALASGELAVEDDPDGLANRVKELYSAAAQDLREGGANTVFLALGSLRWRRKGRERDAYRAPLILVPLTLKRESLRSPVRFARADDEISFNATLVQLMRQEFDLDLGRIERELPKKGAGVDVVQALHAVGQAVLDVEGWEVEHDAAIARFGFSKHLMWRDLVEREGALRKHPIIRHLIDAARGPIRPSAPFPDPATLDETAPPDASFVPLSADASQLAAVEAAAAGASFVLIGPPGTGKSQTIANMIAQLLAEKKRVLFVAEKTAALDVVARRLEDVGLGDFCIELHSNRSSRAHLLDQIDRAWRREDAALPEGWIENAAALRSARARLNASAAHLHVHTAEAGLTTYDAMGIAARGRDALALGHSWSAASAPATLARLLSHAERCDRYAATLEPLARAPLRAIAQEEWTPRWRDALLAAAERMRKAARALGDAHATLTERLGVGKGWRTRAAADLLVMVARRSRAAHWVVRRAGLTARARAAADLLAEAAGLLRARAQLIERLSTRYDDWRRARLDIARLTRRLVAADAAPWPLKAILRETVKFALSSAAAAPPSPDILGDLGALAAIAAIEARLEALDELKTAIGGRWRGAGSDLGAVETIAAIAGLANALQRGLDAGEAGAHRADIVLRKIVRGDPSLTRAVDLVGVAADGFDRSRDGLEDAAGAALDLLVDRDAPDWLDAVAARAAEITAHEGGLATWCGWRRAAREARAVGIGALVDGLESGALAPGGAREAVEVDHARFRLGEAYERDPDLRAFSLPDHEGERQRFLDADRTHGALAAAAVRARLAGDAPRYGDGLDQGPWAVLWRELKKKRSVMTVRALMDEAGEAISALSPCMLMSPASAAQYLPEDWPRFDVVIFDEASQIPVWDAVGVIGRGKNVVVVGDPNQLPPTSFFQTSEAGEETETAAPEDLESILDECIAAGMPTWRLVWHYRSRAESLITFSNRRYYDGALATFPAPVATDQAVSLARIEGVSERGAGVNHAEAEAIVAEIVARQTSAEPDVRRASIGVITSNVQQQRLISKLLEERRAASEEDEAPADDVSEEPLFVRNLESVQGDERDVILLSVGYGRDGEGRLTMNFGPLNRLGGERRLNVAITRARRELKVFASLDPEDIDLARTRAKGVADFRAFLEFARDGADAAPGRATRYLADPLAEAVAQALTRRGWRAKARVGASADPVAVGVEHPDKPGVYFAAVETDGPSYARALTARDRERLRPEVLEGLGWRVERVWAADWYSDPDGALERLDGRLRAALEPKSAGRCETRAPQSEALQALN